VRWLLLVALSGLPLSVRAQAPSQEDVLVARVTAALDACAAELPANERTAVGGRFAVACVRALELDVLQAFTAAIEHGRALPPAPPVSAPAPPRVEPLPPARRGRPEITPLD
jgi:hypothetical protein